MLSTLELDLNTQPKALVIWCHGLGARGDDFLDLIPALQLPQDYPLRFAFPNAPEQPVTINNGMVMPAWFDIYSLTRDGGEDEAGILNAEKLLHDVIDAQLSACQLGPEQLILAGYSQGGALALFAGLRYPKKIAGIMSLSAYLPLPHRLLDSRLPVNQDTPIFMAHGEYDDVVQPQFARKGRQWLMQQDYRVDWHQYPMGHMICPQEVDDIRNFLLMNFALDDINPMRK